MFDQLGGVDVGDKDRGIEWLIHLLHECQGAIAVTADDNAVGLHQVGHGAAFAQELWIAHHIEVSDAVVALDRVGDFFARFDRNGALINDHAIFIGLEDSGDFPGHALDEAQVHASIWLRRRGNGNEDDLRVVHTVFDAVGEAETLGGDVSVDKFFQAGFVDRDFSSE